MALNGIYLIRNIDNFKVYVGSSSNIERRWKNHLYLLKKNKHHSKYLQRAFNKHGIYSFVFCILEYVNIEQLKEREQWWINHLNSYDNKYGYNVSLDTTSPSRGLIVSKETRKKISEKNLGHPNYLLHHSIESIEKIRLASLGRRPSEKSIESARLRMIGNTYGHKTKGIPKPPISDNTRKKISESNKGKVRTKEQREKYSKSAIGKKMSDIARKKMSDSKIKHWGKIQSPTGEIYDVTNAQLFSQVHNLDRCCLMRVFNQERKTHKGWKLPC